jgi:hypothetical protein
MNDAAPLPQDLDQELAPKAAPGDGVPRAKPTKDEPKGPDLARLKKMFDEARDLTDVARREAIRDIDYYDSKQWTLEEKAALKKRKQPDIVINRIKPAVNGILGVVQRSHSEPRCWPRTPKDEDSADVATDALRYIGEHNRFDALKLEVFRDMLIPGSGAAVVEVDADLQVTIQQIRWEEFFYDPRSRRRDFKDARYLGVAKWMYADDVAARYADKRDEVHRTVSAGGGSLAGMSALDEHFGDRPSDQGWSDQRSRRLLVVDMYYRDAQGWNRCVFHAGGLLEAGPSPYLDHRGQPDCPIEGLTAFVDRENNRYGVVRDMRGPQDEVNKRRSKALHLLSTRMLKQAAPGDVNVDEARREAARPDGVLPYNYDLVHTGDMTAGHLNLLQEAKSEIERMGPNPAILGRETASASGRALLTRQQSGMVELSILFGALEDWELRVYRQMWARARQFWRDPMWIRITDDEGAPKFVQLNAPEMGPPQVVQDPATGQVGLQPMVLGYKNQVAEMDVDIIIDATADTANVQQEQFQSLVQLVSSNSGYAAQVPFELMLEMSSIPHKRHLSDRLKGFREEQQKAQGQQRQQQMAIQAAAAQAAVAKTTAEARKLEAEGMFTAIRAQTAMADAGGPTPQFGGAPPMGPGPMGPPQMGPGPQGFGPGGPQPQPQPQPMGPPQFGPASSPEGAPG